jgi:outer membrane receptor protein involved in Fe transport
MTPYQPKRFMRDASLVALASAFLMPVAALAQEPAARINAAAPSDADAETIVVTGSRIARTGFSTPTPVTVVGQEDIQRQATSNVADLLNTLPAFRPQSTPATAGIFNANAGANSADLRGLGANRTLVLVDGRRFVASTTSGGGFTPSGTVDLNMIPTVLIARTEVVTGGASAAYGSDAVAGVVNLILDTKLDGFRGSLQGGLSERGDYGELFATGAWGSSFAGGRGHFVIGGEYADNQGTGDCYSRAWCAESYNTISNPTPQLNGLARQILLPNTRTSTSSFGGLITSGVLRGTEFASDGSFFKHDYGTFYGTPPTYANGGIFQAGGSADPVNGFYNNFPLVVPVERLATLAHASYEISDAIEIFAEGSYGRVKSGTLGAASRNTGNITIQRDNAYLPDALEAQLVNANQTSFSFGRVSNDIGAPIATTKRETWRVLAGAKGDIGSRWKWDAYAQYGRTDYKLRTSRTQIIDNFARAVDAVDEGEFLNGVKNGNIVCRVALTNPALAVDPITGACRPLNLFGQNRFDPAAVAYAYGTVAQDTKLTQAVFAANVQGDLFDLPAGPLSIAVGGEYRVEDAEGTADPISTALRFLTGPGSGITGPAIKVKEAYAEVAVPLLKDSPLGRLLSVDGAVRVTDYSTSGSVTSWKVGGVYEPIELVRFRVTRSRDIRAPNFFELYAPLSTSFQFLTDPQNSGSFLTSVFLGGNPALKPEVADTFTGGIVLSPTSRLRLSADYFDIKLKGAISTLGGQVIVNRCDQGATEFCSLIARDSGGLLSSVRNVNLNLNTLKTRGVDIEGAYGLPLGSGDLSFRLLGTYTFNLSTIDATGLSVDRAGMNGGPVSQPSGMPNFTGSGFVTYSQGPFSGTVQLRYVSSGVYNATLIGPHQKGYSPTLANSISDNFVGDEWRVNLNVQYDIVNDGRRKMQIFGVINNLFDRSPPNDLPSSFGVTNPVLYDTIGRSYKAGLRFTL